MTRAIAILFACFAAFCSVRAEVQPVQTVIAEWAYGASPTGTVFYVAQRTGIVTNVVGIVSNATVVTMTNVIPGAYEWIVISSNMWGTEVSTPFITPAKPLKPGPLRPISTSFRVTPPVSFERTSDLISWEERFRLFRPDSNGVQVVMHTIRPDEPFSFYRVRPTPLPGMPGN